MTTSATELRARKDLDPGWWRSQTGPAQVLIVGVVVLVLAVLYWVLIGQDAGPATMMPSVVGQGEAIALTRLRDAGFNHLKTHDALGRDRAGKPQQWQVCFQVPQPGLYRARSTHVDLGLVKTTESCPSPQVGDQGIEHDISLDDALPDFTQPTNWTAYIAGQDFGDDASVRFVDQAHPGRTVTDDLGDWLICSQTPPAHEAWHGRPVTLVVARYEQRCH